MSKTVSELKIIESNLDQTYMKYSAWLSIKDSFPLERIVSIKYASKKASVWKNYAQFKTSDSFLCSVDIALINKQLYKINGIIRKGLWKKQELITPSIVIIRVHKLDIEFYKVLIDSLYPISAKSQSQYKILSCYKNHNLTFNSDRLRHGFITDALNIALRGEPRNLQDKRILRKEVNTDLAIEHFKTELILIDSISPNIQIFTTGVLAAALLMLSIDDTCIEFFIQLNNYEGLTKDEKQNPVEALLRIIELLKKKSGSDVKIQVELCSKTVRAILAWKLKNNEEGYWIKRLSSIDFLPYIRQMKKLKNIHGIKYL